MFRSISSALLCLFYIVAVGQRRLYTAAGAPANGDGLSWATAFTDLQDALRMAKPGDSIWVARGTYKPTNTADRTISFAPPSGVKLFGGFSGAETNMDQRDWERHPTVLSGDIGRPNDSTDNSYNVVYWHFPDTNSVLDGFTVRNGTASFTNSSPLLDRRKCGGGIYIMGADWEAYGEVRNCTFLFNYARNYGGGVVVNGSGDGSVAPRFINCRFDRNRSFVYGGGLARIGSSFVERGVDFEGCTFVGNIAYSWGGGLLVQDAEREDKIEVVNSRFEDNSAGIGGAALWLQLGRQKPNDVLLDRLTFGPVKLANYETNVLINDFNVGGVRQLVLDHCNFYENKNGTTFSLSLFGENGVNIIKNCNFKNNNQVLLMVAEWAGEGRLTLHESEFFNNVSRVVLNVASYRNITGTNIQFFQNTTQNLIYHDADSIQYNNCLIANNIAKTIFDKVVASKFKIFLRNCCIADTLKSGRKNYDFECTNSVFPHVGDQYKFFEASNKSTLSHCWFDALDPAQLAPNIAFLPSNLIGVPPQFRDTANHDYRLLPCSPLVDAGDNTGVSATDLDGKPRIQGQRVDIGAYETSGLGWATAPQARASCPDTATGGFLLRPDNGCPPYQIQWRNGNLTGSDTTGLAPGTYVLTLTDGRGQTLLDTLKVAAPPAPKPAVATTPVQCGLALGGSATASSADGVPPLRFNWNNGLSGTALAGLAPGAYTVTATDARGCSGTATATVGRLGALALLVGGSPISCAGRTDGRLSVTPFGGKPPFRYDWNQGGTDSLLTGLPPGPYTVTVSDAFGCSGAFSFSLNEPDPLRVVATAQDATASNVPDGRAAVSGVTGGTSPYRYHWSTAATTEAIAMLLPGTYTVTVTDHRGCTDAQTVVVKILNAASEAEGRATLVFFPNPTTDAATVAAHWPAPPNAPRLQLFDVSGRLVLDTPLPNAAQDDVFSGHIPLEGLPAGIYTAVLLDDTGRVWGTGRVVKGE